MPVNAQRQRHHLSTEAIWQDMHGPLLGFIARRVPDRDSAEDILQDVMLRIHRHASELKHTPAVGGWIYEIARNAIIDHYRRAVVRRELPSGSDAELDYPVLPALESTPAELRRELAACLNPLLEQLPAIYREALTLTELGDLTQTNAAARVGLSTSGMKTRVQRARTQLKQLLVSCCAIELDRRGGIINYQPPNDSCDCRTSTPSRQQAENDAASVCC